MSQPLADRLAQTTLDLIEIESVTGNEAAIADHVENVLRDIFDGQVIRSGNSVIAIPEADDRPTLALFGHLDTVPGREDQPPRRDDVNVYGTGASDMKGALAVMLALAEDLNSNELPIRPAYVFYDKEEGPYVDNGLEPLYAAHGAILDSMDLAICMEPTCSTVQMGCTGTLHATVRIEGKRAHSARPWQGENAIHKAGPLLTELLGREPVDVYRGDLLFREVITATVVRSPQARNVVPDFFEINLNYRFAPGKSLQQAQQDIVDLVAGRAEVEFTDLCPSGEACIDNPHVKRLLEETGAAVEPKQAWTDVARLQGWGIDAINYGPGESAQAHQRNEYAPISPMVDAYHALRQFFGKKS